MIPGVIILGLSVVAAFWMEPILRESRGLRLFGGFAIAGNALLFVARQFGWLP